MTLLALTDVPAEIAYPIAGAMALTIAVLWRTITKINDSLVNKWLPIWIRGLALLERLEKRHGDE